MAGYHSKHNQKRVSKIALFALLTLFSITCAFIAPLNSNDAGAANATVNKANCSKIVMEVNSLRVFDGQNADVRLPMASTTKVMTALVVIENRKMDEIVIVPKAAVGVEGSSIYLCEGEKLTVKELLYGLMLRSGNDAATALALHTAGSIGAFAGMMNARADSLGLKNTHFVNPHGLHDPAHYTSAYDLAVISSVAMRNAVFKEIVSTKNITVSGNNEEQLRFFNNKNKILSMYRGGNGVKTGFTKNAGRCLVAASLRDGMQVVAVVLNVPDMWEECSRLMDYAHGNYAVKKLVSKNEIYAKVPVEKGKSDVAALYCPEEFYYPLKKDGSEKAEIVVNSTEKVKAPVKKQTALGTVEITLDNRLLFSQKIYTMEDIEKKGIIDKFKDYFS